MDTNQDLWGKTPAHYALADFRPMVQTAKDSYQAAESALLAVMEGQAHNAEKVILADGVDALTDDDIAAVLAYFLLRGEDNLLLRDEAKSSPGSRLMHTAGEALRGCGKWMITRPWAPVLEADMSRVWTRKSKPVDVEPVLEDILLALSRHWNDEPMMLITKSPKEQWHLTAAHEGEWMVIPLPVTLARGYGPFKAQNLQDALEGIRDKR